MNQLSLLESATQIPDTARPGHAESIAASSYSAPADTLVRKSDPHTSLEAARRATAFVASHEAKIYAELDEFYGATSKLIADETGLTVVQVARRMASLERRGLVVRHEIGTSFSGHPIYSSLGGFCTWWKAP